MPSIRVVHISTVHSWQDPRIFEKECKSLAKNGYEVHIITPDGIDEMVGGVMIHKLQYTIKNRIERYLRASKKIFSQAKKLSPNVIHFHDPELIPEALRAEKEGYKMHYVVDEKHQLADAFGATTTPHIFLFNRDAKLAYRGLIDDNGKEKEAVTQPYLKNAIKAMIANDKIDPEVTKSIGCSIKREL